MGLGRFQFAWLVSVFLAGGLILELGCNENSNKPDSNLEQTRSSGISLLSFEDSVAYGIGLIEGVNLAESFRNQQLDTVFERDIIASGFATGVNEQPSLMTVYQAQAAIDTFLNQLNYQLSIANRKAANDFLEENKLNDSILETSSGLQYVVINEGIGEKPSIDDDVKVRMKGSLLSGYVLENSFEPSEPIIIKVRGIIRGITEGLQLMKVGGHYKFFIGPDLGFGKDGPQEIEPNQVLIYEIQLLDVTSR